MVLEGLGVINTKESSFISTLKLTHDQFKDPL